MLFLLFQLGEAPKGEVVDGLLVRERNHGDGAAHRDPEKMPVLPGCLRLPVARDCAVPACVKLSQLGFILCHLKHSWSVSFGYFYESFAFKP